MNNFSFLNYNLVLFFANKFQIKCAFKFIFVRKKDKIKVMDLFKRFKLFIQTISQTYDTVVSSSGDEQGSEQSFLCSVSKIPG